MKKRLIQLTGIFALSFMCLLLIELTSKSGESSNSLSLIFGHVNAQIYEACPGTEVALSHPVFGSVLCPTGGSYGEIPRLVRVNTMACEMGGWCCPIEGFNSEPACASISG